MPATKDRIVITKEVELTRYEEVDVDVTDEVNKRADELAKAAVKAELLDINAAIVGTLRLARTGEANSRTVLDLILKLIGSDVLTREIRRAIAPAPLTRKATR